MSNSNLSKMIFNNNHNHNHNNVKLLTRQSNIVTKTVNKEAHIKMHTRGKNPIISLGNIMTWNTASCGACGH